MTPEEYIERFKEQRPAEFSVVRGVTGRFIRGTRPSDFKMLSDEPGKKLSWSLPVTRPSPALFLPLSSISIHHTTSVTSAAHASAWGHVIMDRVCGGELLGPLLGLSPAEAMVKIGFDLDWWVSISRYISRVPFPCRVLCARAPGHAARPILASSLA